MPNRTKLLTCLAAAVAVGAFAAPAASAATTIGNSCTGNRGESETKTLVQLNLASGAASLVAPESGVITKWSVGVIPYPGGVTENLKVMRPAPGKDTFTVVGQSSGQSIVSGANSFETRLPIQAGDRIGIGGSPIAIYCNEEAGATPADVMGEILGDQGVNSTAAFAELPGAKVAVTATIEKDADGDGFGDETQDKCPQNAAVQVACPVLNLDAFPLSPTKSAAKILVTSSLESAITVSASAKIAKTKKGKASSQAKLAPISQLVTPGKIAVYTMNFTKALKDALASLPGNQSLKLKVKVRGKNLDGTASSGKTLTVKLKGQARSG